MLKNLVRWREICISRLVLVCVAALFASCAMADARDGLRHWWRVKDLNSDGLLQANEVYDAMTVSAATPLVGQTLYQSTDLSAGAKPVCITNDVYMPTLRKNVSDDAIHFFNPTNYDANGTLKINYQALQLPKTASVGCTAATVVVRCKWDGARFKTSGGTGNYNYNLTIYSNNYNPNNATGWRVGLRCFDSGTSNRFHPFFDYGNQEMGFHYGSAPEGSSAGQSFVVYKDVWYDIAYTFRVEYEDGNKYVYASVLYRKGDATDYANRYHKCQSRSAVRYTSSWTQYDASVFAPCIGFHRAGVAAPGWDTFGNATSDDGFTGSIHEIKVYDRCMTEPEMLQCLGGMDPLCTIGSANGSADEFSDVDAADVYDPATMDWSRMRKTLNGSTPSTSIRWNLDADNLALSRLVEVRLLKDSSFSGDDRIRLDVNGARVGRWTVPADGIVRFFIQANRLAGLPQDAVTGLYPLTLTLTREGSMSGDIKFDSLVVEGAWQLGKNDNSADEFASSDQTYHAYNYFLGQNDLKKLRVSTAGQGLYRDTDVHFGIADWLAANCDYRLTVKSTASNAASMNLYLNDMSAAYDSIDAGGLAGGRVWTIPAGTFLGGGNCIRLRNLADGLMWVSLDYIRLEPVVPADFKNTDDGALLIFR